MEQTGAASQIEPSSLSFADIEDLPEVAELYLIALKELKMPCAIDPERVVDAVLKNWACAPCILLKKEDVIIGFYGLKTYTPDYSNELVLGDYMLFILPEHRSYKAARALSIAARDFADEKGLILSLNFIAKAKEKFKARFLENMGAQVVGVQAIYDGRNK